MWCVYGERDDENKNGELRFEEESRLYEKYR